MEYLRLKKEDYLKTKIILNIGFIPLLFFIINKTQITGTFLGNYLGTDTIQLIFTFIALLFVISLFAIAFRFTKTNTKAKNLAVNVFHKSFNIGVWGTISLTILLLINFIADYIMKLIQNSTPTSLRNGIITILVLIVFFLVNKYSTKESDKIED
ncbi:MAG TPA: hypothetical protein VJI52_05545 [Candidatus Nanoarchaeia archaeon]|nr:hypothetical protein [Candidatus Nanoarchaeia archaeon]